MKSHFLLRTGAAILSVCLLISAAAFADDVSETPTENLKTESEVFRIDSDKTTDSADKTTEETAETESEEEPQETFTILIARPSYIFTGPGNEYKKIQAITKGETYTAYESVKSKTGFEWYRILMEDGLTDAYIPAIATIPEPPKSTGAQAGSGSYTPDTTPPSLW